MPSSRRLRSKRRELLLFQEAQPRRGLVEQQQQRIGGERAGDLDDALPAQRQRAGRRMQRIGQSDACDLRRRLGAHARFLAPVETQRGASDAGAAAQVRAERDVVEHRHARDQLDMLERAADAQLRDLERLPAADRLAVET